MKNKSKEGNVIVDLNGSENVFHIHRSVPNHVSARL